MIEIRELRDGDLESVRGLLAQLAAHASTGGGSVASIDIGSTYRELRETPSVYQNWVAVEGGRVIGFLSLMFYKTLFHAGGAAQRFYRRNGFDEEYVLLGMEFHRRGGRLS
jgi:hypothetical protein